VPVTLKGRDVPWWAVPLAIFLVTRAIGAVLIILAARDQVGPSLQRPYGVPPLFSAPPTYLHVIANWDGQWYQKIAEHGYPGHLPIFQGQVQQNAWVYYPLFPLLTRMVMVTGASFGLAASIVNLVCGAFAMCLLYRMLHSSTGHYGATMAVIALCTFPAAIVLQVAYSETLALLLVLIALWCLREDRHFMLLATGIVLAFTRPIALPLALVVTVCTLLRWRVRRDRPFARGEAFRLGMVAAMIALSSTLWPLIASLVTGRGDAFISSRRAFSSQTTHGWPSWIVLLLGGREFAFTLFVALGIALFVAVVARPETRLWGQELRTWSWVYALYLLASTRPTSSITRYAMLAVVPWWPFPDIGTVVRGRRNRVGLALVVASVGVVSQYFWVRWFFIISTHNLHYP
jgi:hypothetical protein